MRWPDWFCQRRRTSGSFDIEATMADGLHDVPSARRAIGRLKRERKAVERERHTLLARAKRVAPAQVRKMARSSPDMRELAVYQVAEAMREANVESHDDALRQEQLAAVEGRLDAINRAVAHLDAYVREGRRDSL